MFKMQNRLTNFLQIQSFSILIHRTIYHFHSDREDTITAQVPWSFPFKLLQ